MLCEKCHENEATIHYVEILNGVKTEHHLCSACADKLDLSDYISVLDIDIPFVKLLTGLLSRNGATGLEADDPMLHVKCPQCGMSFAEFTNVGKFGCQECFNVFGPLIEDNMKKLQGSIEHKGKTYKNIKDNTLNQKTKRKTPKQVSEDDSEIMMIEKNAEKKLTKNSVMLAKLQHQLTKAVKAEEFEEAAKLRDEIRALKGRNDNNG